MVSVVVSREVDCGVMVSVVVSRTVDCGVMVSVVVSRTVDRKHISRELCLIF